MPANNKKIIKRIVIIFKDLIEEKRFLIKKNSKSPVKEINPITGQEYQ